MKRREQGEENGVSYTLVRLIIGGNQRIVNHVLTDRGLH